MSMGDIRKVRTEQNQPIEDTRPGDNAWRSVGKLYEYGRVYPHGKPHDYRTPQATPKSKPIAPDESQCQFNDDKTSNHVDVREAWTRGMGGQSPYPKFDSGKSGNRYRGK
jgi:hypothetical protein